MIYYDPHFRSDVILSALLQAFIFVLQSLEKIYIFGLCGIFGCSTSNDHWKNAKLLNCQSGIQLLQCIHGVEACVGMKLP